MTNNIYNILKNNIDPKYLYVLKQFQNLNKIDKEFMKFILFDLVFLWDDPYSKKNFDNNKNFYNENFKIKEILDNWLVKIWKLNNIPFYWKKYKENYNNAQNLKEFDTDSDTILKYLSKDKYCFDYKYIYSPAFYSWQLNWNIKISIIDKIFNFYTYIKNINLKIFSKNNENNKLLNWLNIQIKSQWYGVFINSISFLEKDCDFINPHNDNTFNKLLTLYKKWIIKFWIIPIIPVKTKIDIINRANKSIALDLFGINEKILSDLYKLLKKKNYIDLYRIIFIRKDSNWPKYWLPSKSRIYYNNNKIFDTNLI